MAAEKEARDATQRAVAAEDMAKALAAELKEAEKKVQLLEIDQHALLYQLKEARKQREQARREVESM